jgi:hypothetical protein
LTLSETVRTDPVEGQYVARDGNQVSGTRCTSSQSDVFVPWTLVFALGLIAATNIDMGTVYRGSTGTCGVSFT